MRKRQKWRDREIMRDKIDTREGNQGRGEEKKKQTNKQTNEKKGKSGYLESFHFFFNVKSYF